MAFPTDRKTRRAGWMAMVAGTLLAAGLLATPGWAAENAAPPAAKPIAKPVAKPATKPAAKPVAKPAAKPTAKPAAKGRTDKDAVTPTENSPDRHAKFVALAQKGNCGLLFLGDSITDHWPSWSKGTWAKLAKYKPLNFGISGEHTEHVLWRVQNGELEVIRPKVVVLMLGTNNFGHTPDKPEWVAAGVKEIIKTIQEKQPQAKVLLLGIFPRNGKYAPIRQKIVAANAILATYDNGTSIRYLDIGGKFLDANGEIPKEIMHDSLHPGDKGYQIWLEAMTPLLEEMMK